MISKKFIKGKNKNIKKFNQEICNELSLNYNSLLITSKHKIFQEKKRQNVTT